MFFGVPPSTNVQLNALAIITKLQNPQDASEALKKLTRFCDFKFIFTLEIMPHFNRILYVQEQKKKPFPDDLRKA